MIRRFMPSRLVRALLLLLCMAACVTVNIYFPAAEVEKTAEEIVSDVYGNTTEDSQSEAPGPTSMLLRALAELCSPASAHAQSVTSVSNASIRGLKAQIAANHQQLAPFYNAGNVGITNTGLLDIRDTSGLGVAQVGQLRRLVAADNSAREQLYAEVAKALKVDPSQVGRVKTTFAGQWQAQAQSGWWIQSPGGGWGKK